MPSRAVQIYAADLNRLIEQTARHPPVSVP
jgi:hypothetical protein